MLESITANLLSTLVTRPIQPAIEALDAIFSDQRAFSYAREHLRRRYEARVRPASYDHVVENLRVTRQDLVDYFLAADAPTKSGLDAHLLQRLTQRVAGWGSNTLSARPLAQLMRDFYEAYERYFFACDPLLSTLGTLSVSNEARALLVEIQAQIAKLAGGQASVEEPVAAFEDVHVLFKVTGTPFDIVETTRDHMDIRVVEPQALVSTSHLFSISRKRPKQRDVDLLKERVAGSDARVSRVFMVTPAPMSAKFVTYAERRFVTCIALDELRAMLGHKVTPDTLLVGRLAAASLAKSLNIDQIFIPPDAVRTVPGDEMEDDYFAERRDVDELIDAFLANGDSRLLVILGDYGSGKSVVAAHTFARFSGRDSACVAAFIPLSQLDHADRIVEQTSRADSTLRTLFPLARQRLVILDGLDEMKDAMATVSRKMNMLRLLDASTKTDKLIVTVRSSYFRGLEDFWSLFARDRDQKLWTRLAKHIPEGSARPRVEAAILREFDSAKILEYVRAVGATQGQDDSFAATFMQRLRENDPDAVYQRLMRSPLYLFLIVNTVPWEDDSVGCLADVIRLFIRYWLERDISKGPSRWLLSTDDRTRFIADLAWWMFQTRRTVLSYAEFDEFVARYFELSRDSEDARVLGIDLHTTGVFSAIGKTLFFAMPAFAHYFIASRFHEGFGEEWPARVPTLADAKLWLGLMAAKGVRFRFKDPKDRADAWMTTMGLDDAAPPFEYDVTGLAYRHRSAEHLVSQLNERLPDGDDPNCRVRAVLAAAIEGRAGEDKVPGVRVSVRIANRLGLHARAAAWFVHRVCQVFPSTPSADLELFKGGERVEGRSILGLLLLAAGRGSIVDLRFRNCEPSKIKAVLKAIEATPADDGSDLLEVRFGEIDYPNGTTVLPDLALLVRTSDKMARSSEA